MLRIIFYAPSTQSNRALYPFLGWLVKKQLPAKLHTNIKILLPEQEMRVEKRNSL